MSAKRAAGPVALEKINAEIFTLTYGSIVRQLLADYQDISAVNNKLEEMGYNIGVRLIDEFLAKSGTARCVDFRDVANKIATVALKSFLNINATAVNFREVGDEKECSIVFEDNPVTDFVELPEGLEGLKYCNVIAGAIRGSLSTLNMTVTCEVVRDMLRGDATHELRLKLLKSETERYPFKDD